MMGPPDGGVPPGVDGSSPVATCTDGLKNGREADVDCGRECAPCADGKMCMTGSDCVSGKCTNSKCEVGAAPAQCTNMMKDADESDVDCGGMICPPCVDGKMCNTSADCKSGACTANLCAMMMSTANCKDMVKDDKETDVDCGGGVCPVCGDQKMCLTDGDCSSGHCMMSKCTMAADLCKDKMKNGLETDVDCGGGMCPACDLTKACQKDTDCTSKTCFMGACASSCGDMMQNGKETDVDCGGGQCPACADGKKCLVDGDCAMPDKCVTGKCGMAPLNTVVSFMAGNVVSVGAMAMATAIATGDVNGDTKQDIVVTKAGANTISILIGDGVGGFKSKGDVMVGSQPGNVLLADVDADTKLDMVVAESGASNVSVYFGNGDGTFQPEVMLLTGPAPSGLAVADFDKDGKLDVAIAVAFNLVVYTGAGNRTFSMMPKMMAAGQNTKAMIAGDWNGDMKTDLALANLSSNNVSVLIGNGDGTFAAEKLYAVGTSPLAIAAGDLNKDGKTDLIVTDRDGADVEILTGNGDGTFGMTAMKIFAAPQGRGMVLADFNGDMFLDAAEVSTVSNQLVVLTGVPMGPFDVKQLSYMTGKGPLAIGSADFNGDSKVDLAIVNATDDTVGIFLNNSH